MFKALFAHAHDIYEFMIHGFNKFYFAQAIESIIRNKFALTT